MCELMRIQTDVVKMTKIIYPDGLRKRLERFSLLCDRKNVRHTELSFATILTRLNVVTIAPILFKHSVETFVSPIAYKEMRPLAKIIRYYVLDAKCGARIAIEQKFSPYADGGGAALNAGTDIFNYESFSCTIHIELERTFKNIIPSRDQVLNLRSTLIRCIANNHLISLLVNIMKTGNCTSHVKGSTESEESLVRPFCYNPPKGERLTFIALKVDGERAKFEILNNILYISQWSVEFRLSTFFAQRLVGHIERFRTNQNSAYRYIIIDLYTFSSIRDKNSALNHLEAARVLNNLGRRLHDNFQVWDTTTSITFQRFYNRQKDAEMASMMHNFSIPTDGYLHFYPSKVVKCKKQTNGQGKYESFATIDLMLKCTVYKAQLLTFLQKKHALKKTVVEDCNGYRTSLSFNNCKPGKHNVNVDIILNEPILLSLQFNTEVYFHNHSPDSVNWTVDMAGCDMSLWNCNDGIVSVCVLEFLVDLDKKCLRFVRVRRDKYVANSVNVFTDMCLSLVVNAKK